MTQSNPEDEQLNASNQKQDAASVVEPMLMPEDQASTTLQVNQGQSAAADDDAPLLPPPAIGKQMAQLVIIPAIIVLVCIGFALMFGVLAGRKADITTYLAQLKQDSGSGRMSMNLQDPRYKDRGLAAYNIATLIPTIKDPAKRLEISEALIDILKHNIAPQEDMLQAYLYLAIGQLGQGDGLLTVFGGFDSPHAIVRQATIGGLLSWPDREAAKVAIVPLTKTLQDQEPTVAAAAAAALGALASPSDLKVMAALEKAMQVTGSSRREVVWNAGLALAQLGDLQAGQYVADLLLNREALAKLPAYLEGGNAQITMPRHMQDTIILTALAVASRIESPAVWQRIEALSSSDLSPGVKKTARRLVLGRQKH